MILINFWRKNMWKSKEPKVEGLLQKREILCEMNFSRHSKYSETPIWGIPPIKGQSEPTDYLFA